MTYVTGNAEGANDMNALKILINNLEARIEECQRLAELYRKGGCETNEQHYRSVIWGLEAALRDAKTIRDVEAA